MASQSTGLATKIRHRVLIQRPSEPVRDVDGFESQSPIWEDYKRLWAKITPLSSNDLIRSQANNSQVTARMLIRHRTDIDTTMRVIHRNKIYSIDSQAIDDHITGNIYCTFNLSGGIEHYSG